ncbi:polygalacturonase [Aphelenchoides avenae]|nr:polygalacturonase [Aphelenchus avenae]
MAFIPQLLAWVSLATCFAHAATSCTVKSVSVLESAKSACTTITLSNVAVPAGQTLDLTGLKSGTKVIFSGTTTFGYKEWEGPLVSVSGTKIQVRGASGSVLDGDGARWWDGKGTNGGKKKPKFFYVHSLNHSNITGITIKNSPAQVFSILSDDITLSGITINNADGDAKGGHNTDAFDIGSSNGVYIYNPIVHNQDDCLAVNSGTNIVFSGAQCTGGHGISIGSVGGHSNNVVKGVTISHCTVKNSDNAVRVKTVYGATGSVSQVTFSNIQMSGIAKYGVVIQQDYDNGKPKGTATSGVPITGLTLDTITGSVSSGAVPVYILSGGAFSGNENGDDRSCVDVHGSIAEVQQAHNSVSRWSWSYKRSSDGGEVER